MKYLREISAVNGWNGICLRSGFDEDEGFVNGWPWHSLRFNTCISFRAITRSLSSYTPKTFINWWNLCKKCQQTAEMTSATGQVSMKRKDLQMAGHITFALSKGHSSDFIGHSYSMGPRISVQHIFPTGKRLTKQESSAIWQIWWLRGKQLLEIREDRPRVSCIRFVQLIHQVQHDWK